MNKSLCIRWLQIACVVTGLVGLVAAAASASATDGVWLWLFDLLDWPLDDNPSRFVDESFALNAVLGGVMVGWAVLMYYVVTKAFANGDFDLVKPMMLSVLAWFAVDSTGSVVAGLYGNVVLNTGFLIIFLPPLAWLLRHGGEEIRQI